MARDRLPSVFAREPAGWGRRPPKKGDHVLCGVATCQATLALRVWTLPDGTVNLVQPFAIRPGAKPASPAHIDDVRVVSLHDDGSIGIVEPTGVVDPDLIGFRVARFPLLVRCRKCQRWNSLELERLPHVRKAPPGKWVGIETLEGKRRYFGSLARRTDT